MYNEIIGISAIIIGIFSFLPIMYKMWITKNHSNFTQLNLILSLCSNLLWIYYGYKNKSFSILLSGILYFCIYSYIVYFKLYY